MPTIHSPLGSVKDRVSLPAIDPPPGDLQRVGESGSERSSEAEFPGFAEWEQKVGEAELKAIKLVFRQRAQAMRKVEKIQNALGGRLPPTLAQLNTMSWGLKTAYNEFSGFHSKVLEMVPDEALQEQEAYYDTFDELYNFLATSVEELILEVKSFIERPVKNEQPNIIVQQQPLSVPIPTFDGSYTSWPKFKAIFQGLMAKSTDSDAIKLFHLDKALTKDAAGILDEKMVSEGNYEQAWKLLEERFENTRIIVESHLRGLLNLKRMTTESFRELQNLLNETIRHVESLRFLKQEITGISEHFIVFLLTNALDKSTRKAWESKQKRGETPKYEATIAFLKTRCQVLESCEATNPASTTPAAVKPKGTTPAAKPTPQKSCAATSSASSSQQASCEFCSGAHMNFQCSSLKNVPVAERKEKVRAAGACFNCLRKGHLLASCPSKKTCYSCNQRHHTILHDAESKSEVKTKKPIPEDSGVSPQLSASQAPSTSALTPTPPAKAPISTYCSCNHVTATKTVLLPTAVVLAVDRDNNVHQCRVLLDSGSQVNFVTEKMANLLGRPKQPAGVSITGINALRSLAREKVFVKFRSRFGDFQASIECLVTPTVTGPTLSTSIDITDWQIPEGIQLADPQFYTPGKIDMLVGAELFFDLLMSGRVELPGDLPPLRETQLGWVATGPIDDPVISSVAVQLSNVASFETLEKLIQRFWQLEQVPVAGTLSPEEKLCESIFLETYKRDEEGRFIVKLPLTSIDKLDDCRPLALKRFFMLEKRLQAKPDLHAQYVEFIREYERLGHCREIKEDDDPPGQPKYYLPHHAVLRPHSTSTQCRVVFDAGAKVEQSMHSLNEILRVGPVVQSDLFSIMLRFRKYAVAFTADLQKMYRQVNVAPEDRSLQRIFWRENPSLPMRVLELNTVTYGTSSAPYQATRCLVQLAQESSADLPLAGRILKDDFYVDDVLSGADTLAEALESQRQLKILLSRGCFPIHKWCSNSEEFLQSIPIEEREKRLALPTYGANETIKVLGLIWDPSSDVFHIANPLNELTPKLPATKRIICSDIARLFDPLGLVAPVVVTAKLFVQQLWTQRYDWDDPISDELQEKWSTLREGLLQLNLIQIPRCVADPSAVAYDLFGFADASTAAYGACLYLRSILPDGTARLSLLCSKSRVAPLHEVSIPRLELCAAHLLALLVEQVLPALKMPIREVVLWSDSTIVLAWLKKPLDQLQVFVRNRVAAINKFEYRWQHIPSELNPADVVSRGLLPEALRDNCLWWTGPAQLPITDAPTAEGELPPSTSYGEAFNPSVTNEVSQDDLQPSTSYGEAFNPPVTNNGSEDSSACSYGSVCGAGEKASPLVLPPGKYNRTFHVSRGTDAPPIFSTDDDQPEMSHAVATPVAKCEPLDVFAKFSSFRKIQRVVAYALRFASNSRKPAAEREKRSHLTIPELRRAMTAIVHVVQHVHLNDEIKRVARGEQCKRIANLCPIYQDGLLRVGGRLKRSKLPFASQHSIILPPESPVVKLYIRALHQELVHIGQSNLINILRQRYWLLNSRSTVRHVTRSCVRCFRVAPTETSQLMGELPETRVVPSPPFAVTGVDYAGPFWIKEGKHRPKLIKAYVAVYVCMTTRAVHLEAVSDLSSDAFIASLRRFIGRRGFVEQLHSDNGTNFKGAKHELHELYLQFCNQEHVDQIQNFCKPREIQWNFIPPHAPEFGGLWEAAVKSMKTHLKRTVGNAKLTFEELATILTEIEAILNSRPMYSMSNDSSDPPVLTPAHFLIGRPLVAPAEPSLEKVKVHTLDRWQHLQLMREHFWRAWRQDYLNSLQPRKKNLRVMPNVRPGMVVLLRDKNLPPLDWKMGRITAVHPGDDGLVRVVDVFCDGSSYRRPITKLSILPIEDNKSDAEREVDAALQRGGECSVLDGDAA